MTVISGGKENLRANFIRENFKGHHGTQTISKSLRHDSSYRNSLGLERTAAEFLCFCPATDATLKVDALEQCPSTRRTALGWMRALCFGVSAGGAPAGSAHRKPRRGRCRRRSPGPVEMAHRDLRGHGSGAPGPIRSPLLCHRARCHPTGPCDRCPPPPACRTLLSRYIHGFLIYLFFQKISCREPGATRAEEFRPFSRGRPQPAKPHHSPPSKITAPSLPSPPGRHQCGTSSSRARGRKPPELRTSPGAELRRGWAGEPNSPRSQPGVRCSLARRGSRRLQGRRAGERGCLDARTLLSLTAVITVFCPR